MSNSSGVFDRTIVQFPFTETDIGGTNSAGSSDAVHWFDMSQVEEFGCLVELGTWNATDDLDTCKLEQATSSTGTGKKDLTTSGASLNYDTGNPVDADGNKVFLSCRSEDLDVANGYRYVRVYLAETGNTGVDNVSAVYVGVRPSTQRRELNGAAATGELVYVKPS